MGAPRARRWKLLLPPFHSAKRKPPLPPPPAPVAVAPAPGKEEEVVPEEFLCPISGAPMADPVILPPGRTYERACVDACAGLSLCPPGASAAAAAAIPNDALRAAIRTWCARHGRAPPAPPSAADAREAVLLRAVPAAAARTTTVATMVPARSSSNLSCSSRASAASTSSSGSSSEMATVEVVEVPRAKEVAELRVAEAEEVKEKEKEVAVLRVAESEEEKEVAVLRVAEAEEKEEEVVMVVAKVVEKGDEDQVEAAMAVLLRETRESEERRRALCVPRLLAALRRVLHSKRHSPKAHADAAAALANLTNEPENRVPIVRAGAVTALVEVISLGTASPEACEHAAGALFGLALDEENRAAIGVLGAVPPLLDLLTARDHAPRARRDAGMALYHLSLSAVNQSKLARAPAAAKNLLSIASDSTTAEPMPIRRLALMVICNLAKCAEGRAALMDTGAVATVSAILSDDAHRSELEELCVAALFGMSRGNPRFRGLARAAGADRPLILISERAPAGVHKEMARKALRVVLGLGDDSERDLPDFMNGERNVNGGGIAGSSVPVHRRRAASWAAAPPAQTPPNAHQWRSVCID
uniref:RING-type E3 ubiquitin transferase n=1 Tax=Oryza meridionalis TaxID=40149 RepID=A0A0E0ELK6_9ORYZ